MSEESKSTGEYRHDELVWMLAVMLKRAGGSVTFHLQDDEGIEGGTMARMGGDLASDEGVTLSFFTGNQVGHA